ncbi:Protein of unknown function [Gryllus bimaculatus]|nr:Protein of unknown function [Gryllus bimaculatus]
MWSVGEYRGIVKLYPLRTIFCVCVCEKEREVVCTQADFEHPFVNHVGLDIYVKFGLKKFCFEDVAVAHYEMKSYGSL